MYFSFTFRKIDLKKSSLGSAKIENDWKVLTRLVSSSRIKCVTLWVKGMSFRAETHQRLVRSCASTWLREHHVCEKCWKSETNSLTELIVTDPDVFFPRLLWKCFNNLEKRKNLGGCFGLVLRSVLLWRCCSGSRNTIRFGKESFSDIQLLRMCAWQEGRFILPGRFSRPPFFFFPFSADETSEAENRFVSGTNGLFQHHGIISSLSFAVDTILNGSEVLKFQWRCVTYHSF